MDTGANKSFLSPKAVKEFYSQYPLQYDPFVVTNIHASTVNQYSITIPSFPEFNSDEPLKFYIYKFHNYFDGLIGCDLLEQWHAEINYGTRQFKTPQSINNICMYTSGNVNLLETVIPANSSKLIEAPVDVQSGDIFVERQVLCNCIVSNCISTANNNKGTIEVCNPLPRDIIFTLTQPVSVELFNSETCCHLSDDSRQASRVHHVLSRLRTDHLNSEETLNLEKLCTKYADIFYVEDEPLTFTNQIKHHITTTDEIPIHCRTYRYPHVHRQEVKAQIAKMLAQGIIQPSTSAWSAPIWVVPKKSDASKKKKWRIVVDFRKLNAKTIDDRYPIPNINDILDKLGKCQYFTTLDLASGFYQVEMNPSDIHKTGFNVENGKYEFLRMPMGLKNSPSTLQRVMDNVLQDLQNSICLVYLDDIIVFSTSLQEHVVNLEKVFKRLRESNFKIQLDKSEFMKQETPYLGHIITPNGVKPNPDKISAIEKYPLPRTAKQIKQFLGLLGYYRKFIPDFARITKPLTQCLKKNKGITINQEYIDCFEKCKTLLINDPILQYPDFSKEFILRTDASNVALGAVLSQGTLGSDKPISYASRTLNESEINYSTIEKELLAIVWATQYFRPYLFGRKFKIITDHKPLQWMMNLKEPNSRITRWSLKLAEYDFTVIYRKGKSNTNADALSRIEIHNEVSSIIANAPEIPNVNELDDSQTETNHTSNESPILEIPISDDPLNKFTRQIVFQILDRKSRISDTITKPFESHLRTYIEVYEPNLEQEILNSITKHVDTKYRTAILVQPIGKMYSIVPIIQNTFKNSSMKLVLVKSEIENVNNLERQQELIRKYHEGKTNHRGISESYLALSHRYFWPKMRDSISKYINDCIVCGQAKYERNPTHPRYQVVPPATKPFEIVHADTFTVEGEKYLTIIDSFSKYAQAYRLPDGTALSVVKALLKYCTHHGLPLTMTTDQGTEFVNKLVAEFLKVHKVNHHKIAVNAPNENGIIERFHGTILEHLRILKLNKPNEHSKHLVPYALLAYNSSIHSFTKCRPFDLITGHFDPRDPIDTNVTELLIQNYMNDHRDKMKTVYDLVHNSCVAQRESIMDRVNRNRDPIIDYSSDQEIYIENPVASRQKLAPRYTHDKVMKNLPIHIYSSQKRGPVPKSRLKKTRKSQLLQAPAIDPGVDQPGPSSRCQP